MCRGRESAAAQALIPWSAVSWAEVNRNPSAEVAGAERRSGGEERARASRVGTRGDVGEIAALVGRLSWRLPITVVSTTLACL